MRGRLAVASMACLPTACGVLLPADPTNCTFLGRLGSFEPETVTRAGSTELRGNQLWISGPDDSSAHQIVAICKRDG